MNCSEFPKRGREKCGVKEKEFGVSTASRDHFRKSASVADTLTNTKSGVLFQSRTLIECSAISACQLITATVDGNWNRYVSGWTLELVTDVRMVSVRYRPLLLVINVTKPSTSSFYDYYS
jgi:hypothetical protein